MCDDIRMQVIDQTLSFLSTIPLQNYELSSSNP